MGKIVFWLVVFFVALLVLRLANFASRRARDEARRPRAQRGETATIRCVRCGVYLPKADALQGPDGLVCGDPQCRPARDRRSG